MGRIDRVWAAATNPRCSSLPLSLCLSFRSSSIHSRPLQPSLRSRLLYAPGAFLSTPSVRLLPSFRLAFFVSLARFFSPQPRDRSPFLPSWILLHSSSLPFSLTSRRLIAPMFARISSRASQRRRHLPTSHLVDSFLDPGSLNS